VTIEPANPTDLDLDPEMETGLEEFDQSDVVVPRLAIEHKEAMFRDTLSGQVFNPLTVIFLGLVKQRVLWHHVMEGNDMPMCKSVDFKGGFPNSSEDIPREKRFPWDKSGFSKDTFDPTKPLPCEGCKLKEWGSHPDGSKPYCTEQWSIPLLYDPFSNDTWVPAIATFQKTSLTPIKAYLTSFIRATKPLFTVKTKIELKGAKRGTNEYAIPSFVTIEETDRGEYRGFSTTFTQIKQFLHNPPQGFDVDDQPAPSENVNRPPEEPASSATMETPTSTGPPPSEAPPSDLPF